MVNNMKVCFAGGGTLGHVYPALSIINDDSFKESISTAIREEIQKRK